MPELIPQWVYDIDGYSSARTLSSTSSFYPSASSSSAPIYIPYDYRAEYSAYNLKGPPSLWDEWSGGYASDNVHSWSPKYPLAISLPLPPPHSQHLCHRSMCNTTSVEFVELRFQEKVFAHTLELYQNLNPGALVKILVRENVLTPPPPSPSPSPSISNSLPLIATCFHLSPPQ